MTALLAPTWLIALRQSVSWGELIHLGITPEGSPYAFFRSGEIHAYWPSLLAGIEQAITDARDLQATTGFRVTVLFVDTNADPARVEAAMHQTATAGLGISFLHAQPQVHLNGLLFDYSEGTILKLLPDGTLISNEGPP